MDDDSNHMIDSNTKITPRKTAQEQSNFISLLLEAAELIEKEEQQDKKKKPTLPPPPPSVPDTIQNVNQLLSNLKSIYNSTPISLSNSLSMDNIAELSSIATFATAAISASNINNTNLLNLNFNLPLNNNQNNNNAMPLSGKESIDDNKNKKKHYINISNITDINSVPIPSRQSSMKITNNTQQNNNNISSNNHKRKSRRIMPNISIKPNLPSIKPQTVPISAANPLIALPKMPLPPSPPTQLNINNIFNTNNTGNNNANAFTMNNGLSSLLNLLNTQSAINDNANNSSNNSVISTNILSALPPIMLNNDAQFTKSINNST